MNIRWLHMIVAGLTMVSVAEAADRIAVVNISSIFQQSSQRAIVAKQLEDEFKERAIELQSMEHDLQAKIHNLQQDGTTMKASERNILEKSVIAQREVFSNKAKEFQEANHSRQTEERNKILNIIQDVVKNIAKKKGYDIVIDTSVIVYAVNTKDITDDVLKQVR